MKVLIDTNVALDVLLKRTPHYEKSAKVLVLSEKKEIDAYISASAATDIYYITRKALKDKRATIDLLRKLIKVVNVAAVTGDNVCQALELEWDDFEDSIQYMAGENLFVEYIVTRNPQDFEHGSITAVTPEKFLSDFSTGLYDELR
jgi:predicted nucleic acid-binding protein